MKKILLLLALTLIFTLAACDRAPEAAPYEPTPPAEAEPLPEEITPDYGYGENDQNYEPTTAGDGGEAVGIDSMANLARLGLTIARDTDGLPLTGAFVANYREILEHDHAEGDTLVIRATSRLYELAVIEIGNEFLDDEFLFIPTGNEIVVGELAAGTALVIEEYMSRGMFPWSAITFLDAYGQRFYFAILQNQAAVDESESYILVQFENRRDELPADWTPSW